MATAAALTMVFIGDKEFHAKTPRRQEKKPLRLCAFA
jgi:hypothetical protein